MFNHLMVKCFAEHVKIVQKKRRTVARVPSAQQGIISDR